MERGTFNPKDIIFALDIGTRSIIGTVGVVREKKFQVLYEVYEEHEERAMIDGQIHDINLVAQVVDRVKKKLENELDVKLEEVSIAAAGRFLKTSVAKSDLELDPNQEIDKDMVRTIELSAVKEAESEVNKNTQGKLYCVGYSVIEYYLNSYIISNLLGHKGEHAAVEVIATFLPRSVIDSLYTVMNKVNLKVINLTLEPIAAIEAAVPKNLRLLNIAMVDIGAGTSDIAISSNKTISSYGMVPFAGDEVTEVIAQEYLVDFNAAEEIKRGISKGETITYTDIMGFENTLESENVKKLVEPVVRKLSDAIGEKITELNGGKSPSAVFLVGGGAHTPGLLSLLADKLNMPEQRIGIKDRTSVPECVASNELGSAGVTVIGIALTAVRSLGNDFIDVTLNGDPISLFNSHKHTILDVLLQAGINPALLIAKPGKNIRFTVNEKKRLAFGEMGTNAVISLNGVVSDLEAEVNEDDKISVTYAQNGKDALAKVNEYISDINSISILIDDEIVNIEPVCLINGEEKDLEASINNEDNVEIFIPNSIELLKEYILKDNKKVYKNDEELLDDYVLNEGDKLYTEKEEEAIEEIAVDEIIEKKPLEYNTSETKEQEDEKYNSINVIVNEEKICLKGREDYIFVDVFNYIDFNLTVPQGNIKLLLNGEPAEYTQKLKDGDKIEIFWEN